MKVPDVESPKEFLCYKQAPNMTRCDRKKGHEGLHSWEAARFERALQKILTVHRTVDEMETEARNAIYPDEK
jgi:hypothetical protein